MSVEIRVGLDAMDVGLIHRYLSEESYWARGIPRETVERSVQNSLCFGAFLEGQQVGFARVVTDQATVAYLGDVFVLAEHRSQGIAQAMLRAVQAHPSLTTLRRWILLTADAHDLYARSGWKPLAAPDRWMEIHHPSIYAKE